MKNTDLYNQHTSIINRVDYILRALDTESYKFIKDYATERNIKASGRSKAAYLEAIASYLYEEAGLPAINEQIKQAEQASAPVVEKQVRCNVCKLNYRESQMGPSGLTCQFCYEQQCAEYLKAALREDARRTEEAQRRCMCDRCFKTTDEYRVQDGEVLCKKCIAELERNANPYAWWDAMSLTERENARAYYEMSFLP